jgi:hypothetical protein
MALTAQYGTPTYILQNSTDLSTALPYTILDGAGKEVAAGTATFTVNKDNPDATALTATALATQVNAALSAAQDLLDAAAAVGTDLIAAVTSKVGE